MNVLTLRLFVALLFLSAESPALAQSSGGVPIAVLSDYRLAPANPWPAGARDVANIVAWTRANVAAHGGDPNKIVLFGHSAGASHVAAYTFERRFQPASGLLCHRDNQCPLMYRFLMHDHISAPTGINTGDETVSTPLLNFVRAR
jgi:hypothetical protein